MSVKESVVINGEEKVLALPMGSIIRLESEQGVRISELGKRDKKDEMATMVKMLWAALIHAEPELTFEEVANNVFIQDMNEVGEALGKLMNTAAKK